MQPSAQLTGNALTALSCVLTALIFWTRSGCVLLRIIISRPASISQAWLPLNLVAANLPLVLCNRGVQVAAYIGDGMLLNESAVRFQNCVAPLLAAKAETGILKKSLAACHVMLAEARAAYAASIQVRVTHHSSHQHNVPERSALPGIFCCELVQQEKPAWSLCNILMPFRPYQYVTAQYALTDSFMLCWWPTVSPACFAWVTRHIGFAGSK